MITNNIDFSVIVCCYNPNLEKLKKTIISIENQKNVSFEIIVSDDGSKIDYLDKLKAWVNSCGFSNIKYNFLKENVGTVKNLISGIECSVGKYIKVISPGDYLFNEFSLERYKKEFETKKCSVVFSRAVYYNDEGKIFNITNPIMLSTEKNRYLKRNVCYFFDCLLGASMACTRDMKKYLDEIKDVVRLLEDFPFSYLTLMNNEKVCFIKEHLVWYEYGTGISTTSAANRLEPEYDKFLDYLKSKYYKNKKIKKSLKCINLRRNHTGIKTTIKMCLIKPSFLMSYIYVRYFQKFRKFKNIDYKLMEKITMQNH